MTLEVRAHRLGATLRLAVRPGAGRTAALGERAGALRLAVAAPPEKGRANREALRFLAEALDRPKADLEILSGALAREKVILCRRLDADALRAKMEGLIRP